MRTREPYSKSVGQGTVSTLNCLVRKSATARNGNSQVLRNGSRTNNGHHPNGSNRVKSTHSNGDRISPASPQSLRGQLVAANGTRVYAETEGGKLSTQDQTKIKIAGILKTHDCFIRASTKIMFLSDGRLHINAIRKEVDGTPVNIDRLRNDISKGTGIDKGKIVIGRDPMLDERPKPENKSRVLTNDVIRAGHKVKVRGLGDKKAPQALQALKTILREFPRLEGNIMVGVSTLKTGEHILKILTLNKEDAERIESIANKIYDLTGVDDIEFVREKEEPVELSNFLLGKYYLELKEDLHKNGWPKSRVAVVNKNLGGDGNSIMATIVFLIDSDEYESKGGEQGLAVLQDKLKTKIKEEMCIPSSFKILPGLNRSFEAIFKALHLPSTQAAIEEDKEAKGNNPFFTDSTAFIKLTVFESELKDAVEQEHTKVSAKSEKKRDGIDKLKAEIRENILIRLKAEISEAASFTKEVVEINVTNDKPPTIKPALKILITPAQITTPALNGTKVKIADSKSERNGKPKALHHTNGLEAGTEPLSLKDLRITCANKMKSILENRQEIDKIWERKSCPKDGKGSISNKGLLPILLNRITKAFQDGRIGFNLNTRDRNITVEIDRLDENNVRNNFFKQIALKVIQSVLPPGYTVSLASNVKKPATGSDQDNGKSNLDEDPDDVDFSELLEENDDFRAGERSIAEENPYDNVRSQGRVIA